MKLSNLNWLDVLVTPSKMIVLVTIILGIVLFVFLYAAQDSLDLDDSTPMMRDIVNQIPKNKFMYNASSVVQKYIQIGMPLNVSMRYLSQSGFDKVRCSKVVDSTEVDTECISSLVLESSYIHIKEVDVTIRAKDKHIVGLDAYVRSAYL